MAKNTKLHEIVGTITKMKEFDFTSKPGWGYDLIIDFPGRKVNQFHQAVVMDEAKGVVSGLEYNLDTGEWEEVTPELAVGDKVAIRTKLRNKRPPYKKDGKTYQQFDYIVSFRNQIEVKARHSEMPRRSAGKPEMPKRKRPKA